MGSSAAYLGITPRVQVHPLCQTTVALALAALAAASEAGCVCAGVGILQDASTNPHAAAKAANFVSVHKDKQRGLPQIFWDEFGAIMQHAGVSASPGQPAISPIKAEDWAEVERASSTAASSGGAFAPAPLASPVKSESGASRTASAAGLATPPSKGTGLKRRRIA